MFLFALKFKFLFKVSNAMVYSGESFWLGISFYFIFELFDCPMIEQLINSSLVNISIIQQ